MDQAAIRLECSRSQMGDAMHTSRCLFFLPVLVLHVMVVEGSVAQASACLTNRDTASLHVQALTPIVTTGAAARLVQHAIPYRLPAGGRCPQLRCVRGLGKRSEEGGTMAPEASGAGALLRRRRTMAELLPSRSRTLSASNLMRFSGSSGRSNNTSSSRMVMTVWSRRAPMFSMRSFALAAMRAISLMPSCVDSNVAPPAAHKAAYCLGRAVLG